MQLARVMAKLEPGGAQLTAVRLSAFLRDHGIDTRMLAGCATREGVAMAEAHGVEVELFGTRQDLQYACAKRFVRWLEPRLQGVDVVHAHMFGGWWAAAHARPAWMPLVASEHNAYRWPGRARTRQMRRALSAVDLFFAHSPAARQLVLDLGLPPERLRTGIGPIAGLEARPVRGLPSPRIVFAGRLHHEKGPDVLLEAIARLDDPPATLILGAGEMECELRTLARTLGVERVTQFLGWRQEPASFIAGASALVVPSRHEAWSQVAVLGMGLGVPVIGAAVEGLPLTLGAGRGVLVPPEDPRALAAALAGVLSGRLATDRRGARAYAFRFSPERVAAVYASTYRSLAAREQPAASAA